MNNKVITLEKEKETLLIPLYGKAMESRKKRPVLTDNKAVEIVSKIDFDFSSLKIPGKTNTMMCLRAKLFDNFVKDYLNTYQESTALHLGCGLDSRYDRINNPNVDWHDLDYKEVIEIREKFFPETEKYHLIPSSVTDLKWLEKVPVTKKPYIVIAEGLFMYLREEEIKTLLMALKNKIGQYTLIFDAYSVLTSKRVKNHPSVKKTGAEIHWGLDDPKRLCYWDSGIKLEKQIYFTSNEEIEKLGFATRIAYKTAHLFPMARNAHRILVYSTN
ncbi:MAG: class I SAM-dependent methyltransferase [Melioribacteraceae bacterium]|nr:class I SAM-dependent methyltransferase [Melioribacteraceae bacterium]